MIEIRKLTVENQEYDCVTDQEHPAFRWWIGADHNSVCIKRVRILVIEEKTGALYWEWEQKSMKNYCAVEPFCTYGGKPLQAGECYRVELEAFSAEEETAFAVRTFTMGRMNHLWKGSFITDGEYVFTEKKISPKVMLFRKKMELKGEVKDAKLYVTAIGMYQVEINGCRVGEDYFTPGFTSYKTNLQYQTYDITGLLEKKSTILAYVAGGWAVGSFVFTRVNRVSADRQAFLCEIQIRYKDGREEILGSDDSWEVSTEGPVRMADLYDGEDVDATIDPEAISYHRACREEIRIHPLMEASYGAPVREHEIFEPLEVRQVGEEIIYDMGQNFAGIVRLSIDGERGQEILVKHAEVLHPDGRLNTDFLRSARASIRYICRQGQQVYSPRFTYMGFRYVSVSGIAAEKIKVTCVSLYSDVKDNGSFACSNEMVNRLQENIRWGAKSNFVDIPTDCPQRDERMGWTGDIALFAGTACYNYDMSRFLYKWLRDMRAEQRATGGIPNTIPSQGYGFPATMPVMAVDFWGDACILVPYAEYKVRGDLQILRDNYEMMKKYVDACAFWARLGSIGKRRYIWHTLSSLHFGDWVAPDVPKMQQWQKRSKVTATASLSNTAGLLSEIAEALGETEDAGRYKTLSDRVAEAYELYLTDGQGKCLEEFQTAYVLPLYFHMFRGENQRRAADHLARLVRENGYRIGTGFPGTPYILFALADNGHEEEAFKMLMNTECPSWLYEVRMGATTIWERWDGLDENGNCPIGDDGTDTMISYNHYASGAVGDFLYRRIAGIEPMEAGYRKFRIKPMIGGNLTWVEGKLGTAYGEIRSAWEIKEKDFSIDVEVPVGSTCLLIMPNGEQRELKNGKHHCICTMNAPSQMADERKS